MQGAFHERVSECASRITVFKHCGSDEHWDSVFHTRRRALFEVARTGSIQRCRAGAAGRIARRQHRLRWPWRGCFFHEQELRFTACPLTAGRERIDAVSRSADLCLEANLDPEQGRAGLTES